jgi:poly-gamma-glutamate synthesis protein (capsule biosynthesis protein)
VTGLRLCLAGSLLLGPADAARAQAQRETLRVVAVGDINFARAVAREYVLAGRGAEIFAGVRDELRSADIAIGNLESLLLDRPGYADPPGSPVFAGPREAVDLLLDAGFDALGTANNHAWDFRRAGLIESVGHLDRAGLAHTGTGATLGEALRPVVLRRNGWTVAVFSVTYIFNDESMSVVGLPAECCVAWADTARLAHRFRAARDSAGADLVLVSLHAGLEYIPVPPADVVRVARGLIRAGADAVLGHHPHVPQGLEYVDGKPIFYSLGNFVFRQERPWTDRGLWAALTFYPDGRRRAEVRPLAVGFAPRFAVGADSAATMRHFAEISQRLRRLPDGGPRRNVARPPRPPGN